MEGFKGGMKCLVVLKVGVVIEELGFIYMGFVDGYNLEELIIIFN